MLDALLATIGTLGILLTLAVKFWAGGIIHVTGCLSKDDAKTVFEYLCMYICNVQYPPAVQKMAPLLLLSNAATTNPALPASVLTTRAGVTLRMVLLSVSET